MTTSPAAVVDESARKNAREYYGKVLQGTDDLKTSACCTGDAIPDAHKAILKDIEDEILTRFYGCGSPVPEALEGRTVLDLGCGTGRDVYLASKLVGPTGRVIGLDMTDEQLEVATRHVDSQMAKFGFTQPNVEFHKAYIEDLASAGIEDESVDVVISNCVINLSPDKRQVFSEIFRVLKPGGELYFSDVYSDRRVPDALRTHPVLHGECLGGALYIEDFRRLLRDLGCPDYRVVAQSTIDVTEPELRSLVGNINFYSITIRAFKLASIEDLCEDYGQVAVYKGTIPEAPHVCTLDDHHRFDKGRAVPVCGNTAAMLQDTRLGAHFTVIGDRSTHYGLFDCSETPEASAEASSASCC